MILSKAEREILEKIFVASDDNPERPEFPPDNPKFPATPTVKIQVPGFNNVWVKDESVNPTGTHKDRMAWELVVTYRNFLLAKQRDNIQGPLPQMSIISSGSAAIAIQTMLKKYSLPPLKVLLDENINPEILRNLNEIGCEIYKADLAEKPFGWKEILDLTENPLGFDITSSDALDPTTRFFDWLSYEIINTSPDYCFIPFGTGNLYENILNITKKEILADIQKSKHDPRFKGNITALEKCNFFGATTNNPKSKADKLYSPHLPFVNFSEQWIRLYCYSGFCGPESDVMIIGEEYLDQAVTLLNSQGIRAEPSGAAGLALMLQLKNKLPKFAKMLIVNTGKTKYYL